MIFLLKFLSLLILICGSFIVKSEDRVASADQLQLQGIIFSDSHKNSDKSMAVVKDTAHKTTLIIHEGDNFKCGSTYDVLEISKTYVTLKRGDDLITLTYNYKRDEDSDDVVSSLDEEDYTDLTEADDNEPAPQEPAATQQAVTGSTKKSNKFFNFNKMNHLNTNLNLSNYQIKGFGWGDVQGVSTFPEDDEENEATP
jgi:hypothetical protein